MFAVSEIETRFAELLSRMVSQDNNIVLVTDLVHLGMVDQLGRIVVV